MSRPYNCGACRFRDYCHEHRCHWMLNLGRRCKKLGRHTVGKRVYCNAHALHAGAGGGI